MMTTDFRPGDLVQPVGHLSHMGIGHVFGISAEGIRVVFEGDEMRFPEDQLEYADGEIPMRPAA